MGTQSPVRTWIPRLILSLLLALVLAAVAWVAHSAIARVRAESHSVSMLATSGALATFVQDNSGWPQSWEQLMPEATPSELSRLSSRISVDWSTRFVELQALAELDPSDPRSPLSSGFVDATEDPPMWLIHYVDPPLDSMRRSEVFWNRDLLLEFAIAIRASSANPEDS